MQMTQWGVGVSTSKPDEKPSKATDDESEAGSVSQEDGHVWHYKEVTQDSVYTLNTCLTKAAAERLVQAAKMELSEPLPVHLHIHSYGGSLFAGFAAADCIRRCRVPVYTHIEGAAASAATIMSVMGSHRTIGKNSFILIHQLSSVMWGKYEAMKDEMMNNDLLMLHVRKLYADRTKMTPEQVEEILKKDLWFDAQKALECGLVDAVV